MASMTIKVILIVVGGSVLLAAIAALWYCTMTGLAAPYQETNATWKIHGFCLSARSKVPINNAEITAIFREPITFKHHWQKVRPETTNVIARTDSCGHFEILGIGGHVQLKVRAAGYRVPEPWEDWRSHAKNRVTLVDTNVVLCLDSESEATLRQGNPSH